LDSSGHPLWQVADPLTSTPGPSRRPPLSWGEPSSTGENLNNAGIVLKRVAVADRPKVVIKGAKANPDDIPLVQFDISVTRG